MYIASSECTAMTGNIHRRHFVFGSAYQARWQRSNYCAIIYRFWLSQRKNMTALVMRGMTAFISPSEDVEVML
jgi:hypothetical protein